MACAEERSRRAREERMESWAKLVPELVVAELEASLRFWRDLIGFSVAYDRPEAGFAYLDLDGAQVMLEQHSAADDQWVTGPLEAPLGRGINFQIEVPALQPILGRLAGAGWPLFMAPEDAWYRAGEIEVGQRHLDKQHRTVEGSFLDADRGSHLRAV